MVNNWNYTLCKESYSKKLIKHLENIYDCNLENLKSYYFYINPKGKIAISTVKLEDLKLDRVNSMGLYFGTMHDNERFRLNIEGTKFIKPKKNFVMLDEKALKSYISGENLFFDEVEMNWDNEAQFLIAIYDNENIGVLSVKDKELLNYLSKGKRLDFNKVF